MEQTKKGNLEIIFSAAVDSWEQIIRFLCGKDADSC